MYCLVNYNLFKQENEVIVYTGDAGSNKTRSSAYHANGEVDESVYLCETDDSNRLWFDGYTGEQKHFNVANKARPRSV